MGQSFTKFLIILVLSVVSFNKSYCEIFIVAKVNQEIITNIDLDFEKKYLDDSYWKKNLSAQYNYINFSV